MIAPVLEQLCREEGVSLSDLNATENLEKAQALQVQSVPTLVFMEDGVEYGRLVGYRRADEIRKYLQKPALGQHIDVKV